MDKGSKVLITGAGGLFGSHLTRYLLDHGHQVVAIDDFSGGYRDFVDPRASVYELNLAEQHLVDGVFAKESPQYVYHFAAYAAEGLSHYIRNFNYTNNILASVNVINGCVRHNVKKMVFTSSMAVYGTNKLPFTEDLIPRPEDPYGIAKAAIEADLRCASEHFGLRYSIVRPHNVIGTQQNIWDRYRNAVGIWIRQALRGEKLSIFGDGSQTRAFSGVRFYMQPMAQLMDGFDSEIFNLGADQYYTIEQVAKIVRDIAASRGYKSDLNYLEARREVKHAYSSHEKAKKLLGFSDGTRINDLIEEMFLWAETQPERTVRNMDYEVEKNLYSFWRKQPAASAAVQSAQETVGNAAQAVDRLADSLEMGEKPQVSSGLTLDSVGAGSKL